MAFHGSRYEDYQRTVPMIIPSLRPKTGPEMEPDAQAKAAGS